MKVNLVTAPPTAQISYTTVLEDPSSSDQMLWPGTVDNNLLSNPASANLDPLINRPSPSNSETGLRAIGAPGRPKSYSQQQKRPSKDDTEICQTGTGLTVPPHTMGVPYPSPFSEISQPDVSPHRFNQRDTSARPERAPSSIGSLSPGQEMDRVAADIKLKERALLRCLHPDCASEPPEFTRRCEYK